MIKFFLEPAEKVEIQLIKWILQLNLTNEL